MLEALEPLSPKDICNFYRPSFTTRIVKRQLMEVLFVVEAWETIQLPWCLTSQGAMLNNMLLDAGKQSQSS